MNQLFKALSDPTRRRILDLLKDGEMTPGELHPHFDISKPSLSHHLNLLKQAEVVVVRRDGKQLYYRLNTTVLQDLMSWTLDFLSSEDQP